MTAATAPLPENALRELDYSQVDVARLIGELRQALPPVALLHDHEDMRPYECDGLSIYRQVPLAVALPGTEAEVAAVLKICHAAGVPVVARGAGTGLSGGALPHAHGVLLSLARMNKILGIDPLARTAVVQPGGSKKDDEVIAAADAAGIAMVMTGHRHFRH